MKIRVFTTTHNEGPMIQWFLRHYSLFADKIVVYDDCSTDGTRDILKAHPKVRLHDWPYDDGINEEHRLEWAYKCKDDAVGKCDWVMVMDSDEFIFGPYKDWEDVPRILERELAAGTEVIQTYGMNIVGQPGHDGVPDAAAHPGKQLWELIPHGVAAPVYSKPVVVRPETKLSWSRGRHKIEAIRTLISYGPLLKLLHFRYLGPNYTAQRNARNLARCGLKNGDKNAAWSCSPERQDKTMEGCPQWASYQQTLSCDVINIPI